VSRPRDPHTTYYDSENDSSSNRLAAKKKSTEEKDSSSSVVVDFAELGSAGEKLDRLHDGLKEIGREIRDNWINSGHICYITFLYINRVYIAGAIFLLYLEKFC
jgi:hypothetical protein